MQNDGTRRNTNRQQNKIKENEFIGKKTQIERQQNKNKENEFISCGKDNLDGKRTQRVRNQMLHNQKQKTAKYPQR